MGWPVDTGKTQRSELAETMRSAARCTARVDNSVRRWGLGVGEAAEPARPFSVQMPYDLPPKVEARPNTLVPSSSQPLGPEDRKPGEQIVTKGTVLIKGQETKE